MGLAYMYIVKPFKSTFAEIKKPKPQSFRVKVNRNLQCTLWRMLSIILNIMLPEEPCVRHDFYHILTTFPQLYIWKSIHWSCGRGLCRLSSFTNGGHLYSKLLFWKQMDINNALMTLEQPYITTWNSDINNLNQDCYNRCNVSISPSPQNAGRQI